MTPRIRWIDQARGLAVVLVVIGHLPVQQPVRWALYSFHVPLFFLLSGMLWKERPWGEYIKKKARTRLLPYAILTIVTYLWWLQAPTVEPWKPLVGMLYGVGPAPWMVHNPPLWFFPCLFMVEVIYLGYVRSGRALAWLLPVGAGVSYLFMGLTGWRLPWGADIALLLVPFFALGVWMGTDWTVPRWWPALIPLCALTGWANGQVDVNWASTHNPILYYPAAVSGSLAVLCAVRALPSVGFEWIGQQTTPIVGLHAPVSWVVAKWL